MAPWWTDLRIIIARYDETTHSPADRIHFAPGI